MDLTSLHGTDDVCLDIADKAKGSVFVVCALQIPENEPSGVEAKVVAATWLEDNEVGSAIFVDFLPKTLAQGIPCCVRIVGSW